jgi:Amt family ammonium transporter
MLTSSALVLLMIPGVGFFYSGLARRKSALSLIWLSMMSIGVVSFQWYFWGYSLTFSHNASAYIGNLDNIGFRNVLGQPSVGSPKVPDLLFAIYQGMFAAITYVYFLILLYNYYGSSNTFLPSHRPVLQEI